MKYISKAAKARQAGFTFIEVLISLAIVGIMGVGAAAIINQTFKGNIRATGNMSAIGQVENVGYWINHDALMTQTVTIGPNYGFPLVLDWQGSDGSEQQVTYSLSGGILQRSLSINGGPLAQNSIAQNINIAGTKTNCSYSNTAGVGVLNFQVTSTIGSDNETRNYQIRLRVDQPS